MSLQSIILMRKVEDSKMTMMRIMNSLATIKKMKILIRRLNTDQKLRLFNQALESLLFNKYMLQMF